MKPSPHKPLLPALVLLCATFTALPTPTRALLCWSHFCTAGTHWCMHTCNSDEIACLAQYRTSGGQLAPSYFGCQATEVPCDHNCEATPGEGSTFTCCCSGDLCNSVEGLTPSGDVPTSPPNTETPPPVSDNDGGFVCLSVHPSIRLFINLSSCLPTCLPACLPVSQSACRSVCLSFCSSVSVSREHTCCYSSLSHSYLPLQMFCHVRPTTVLVLI